MKTAYSAFAMKRQDFELAETFFNSITRRTFATVGVDPAIEFVDSDFVTPPTKGRKGVFTRYEYQSSNVALVGSILGSTEFASGFAALDGDALRVVGEIETLLSSLDLGRTMNALTSHHRSSLEEKAPICWDVSMLEPRSCRLPSSSKTKERGSR